MERTPDELIADALAAKRDGRFDLAKTLLASAIGLLREKADPLALAQALRELGEVERSLPGTDGGIASYEEAVAIFRQQGADLKLAHTIRHLADIQRHALRLQDADRNYQASLELYRSRPEAPALDVANALRGAALLKEATGEAAQAIALWTAATTLYEKSGVSKGADEGRRRLARLGQKAGDSEAG